MNTPSKEAIEELIRKHYTPVIQPGEGAQMFDGQWWMPKWGCDTLEHLIEDFQAALDAAVAEKDEQIRQITEALNNYLTYK